MTVECRRARSRNASLGPKDYLVRKGSLAPQNHPLGGCGIPSSFLAAKHVTHPAVTGGGISLSCSCFDRRSSESVYSIGPREGA